MMVQTNCKWNNTELSASNCFIFRAKKLETTRTSAVDIHFWIHFSCDLIGPGQTKTKQGWPRETGTNQIATRKFLRSVHIEVQIINVKSVCRQHSLIYLNYNISTDISSLFSDSKKGLADSFQHIFLRMNRGSDNSKRGGDICPATGQFVP